MNITVKYSNLEFSNANRQIISIQLVVLHEIIMQNIRYTNFILPSSQTLLFYYTMLVIVALGNNIFVDLHLERQICYNATVMSLCKSSSVDYHVYICTYVQNALRFVNSQLQGNLIPRLIYLARTIHSLVRGITRVISMLCIPFKNKIKIYMSITSIQIISN